MATYFIADLHFGHKNTLGYDNRPWQTIEENDRELINRWNNTVGMDDDVYILGDISWYNASRTIEIFNQLNGNKYLIRGNHDKKVLKSREVQALFVEITDYKEIDFGYLKLILSHYPILTFNGHFYNHVMLYGHVHNTFEWEYTERCRKIMTDELKKPCRMYNVGCMMKYIDYTPRTLGEILEACENGEK